MASRGCRLASRDDPFVVTWRSNAPGCGGVGPGAGPQSRVRSAEIVYAAFFSALRHLVQRSSLLVSFLWKVWPQLMQISRPLSFLPMPLIVASGGSRWQKSRPT
jgi:hypothetical protein